MQDDKGKSGYLARIKRIKNWQTVELEVYEDVFEKD